MAKEQMTFSLGIKTTADMTGINQLKASLRELGTYASEVDVINNRGLSAKQIATSTTAVRQLGNALDAAFDVNLNGINFNTFQKNLKASGTDLSTIGKQLSALGPEGQAAFAKTTAQVFKMNNAVQYSNKAVDKLWMTFKNTLLYTGFNAAFNTISKTISQALGYIKDLDSSLNNIRIVSGQSAEQMQQFAKSANDAAKTLGTSTTEYTDAALIYYQQGLRGTDVTERTDVTTKMANVTGDTAQKVSEDLTAIWNNFYDGSQSLEYYADVITALGASTASSSSEISEGLEKFAAIADTVGLSYEYATSALATVVAETRQSADVVGTAFKTLFARIQGLKLGETLDDGTDLNKYSQALIQVGVNIKGANGDLKDMDQILDELGQKWGVLNKDQKVALAQTVAGTRQYAQLVALMDNWGTFQDNLETAYNATGELEKQQAVYMESTEAHLKKLKAASEDLYGSLFDSKSMNNWIDGFTKMVELADSFVESLGGLNNIAPMLMFGGLNAISGKMASNISQSIMNKRNNEAMIADDQLKNQYLVSNSINAQDLNSTTLATTEYEKQLGYIKDMYQYTSQMTKQEKDRYNNLVESGAELVKQTISLEQLAKTQKLQSEAGTNLINLTPVTAKDLGSVEGLAQQEQIMKTTSTATAAMREEISKLSVALDKLQGDENEVIITFDTFEQNLKNNSKSLQDAGVNTEAFANKLRQGLNIYLKDGTLQLENYINFLSRAVTEHSEYANVLNQVAVEQKRVNDEQAKDREMQSIRANIQSYIQLASSIGQVAMGIQTIKNIGNIWSNEDVSTGEKILQTIINLSMVLPMMTSAFGNLSKSFKGLLLNAEKQVIKEKEIANLKEKIALEESAKKDSIEKARELKHRIHENKILLDSQKAALEQAKLLDIKNAEETKKAQIHEAELTAIALKGEEDRANIRFVKSVEAVDKMNLPKGASVEGMEKNIALMEDNLNKGVYNKKESANYIERIEAEKAEIVVLKEHQMATEEYLISVEKRKAAEIELNNLQKSNIVIEESETTKNLENSISETENSIAKDINSKKTLENGIASKSESINKDKETLSENANTTSTIANTVEKIKNLAITIATNKAYLAATIALAAITVGITAYTYAVKKHQQAVEKDLDLIKEQVSKNQEKNKEYAEEKQRILDLSSAYGQLIQQYKNGELSSQSLKEKTYELCLQYNQEELAIKSLSSTYSDFNNLIKEAQINTIDKEIENLNNSNKDLLSAMITSGENINAQNSSFARGMSTMDWTDKSGELDLDYQKSLFEKFGDIVTPFGIGFIDTYFDIKEYQDFNREFADLMGANYDSLTNALDLKSIDPKKLAANYDDLKYALASCNDEIKEQQGWKDLNKFLNENDEYIKELQNNYKTLSENNMIKSFNIFDNDKEKKLLDIEKLRTQLFNDVKDVYGDSLTNEEIQEIANDWLNKTLLNSGNKEYVDLIGKDYVIQQLRSDEKAIEKELYDWVNSLDKKEIAFLTLHIDAVKTKEEAEEFLKDFDSYIEDVYSKEQGQIVIEGYLNDKDRKSSLTNKEVKNLYESTDIEKYINQDVFENMSYDTQYQAMMSYYSAEAQEISKNKELLQDNAQSFADESEEAAKKAGQAYNDFRKQLEDMYDSWAKNNKDQSKLISKEQFLALADAIDDIDSGKASKEVMDLWNLISDLDRQSIRDLHELGEEKDKANAKNEVAVSTLNDVVDSTRDYVKELEYVKNCIDRVNTSIDDAQKAYHLLNSSIDDYNEKGYITMDNIQSILALDSSYLDTLEIEGNQLSVNEDMYYALALAKMEEQKANVYNQAAMEIAAYVYQKINENTRRFTDETIAATMANAQFEGQVYNTDAALQDMINTLKSMPDLGLNQNDLNWIDNRYEEAKKAADLIDIGKVSAKKDFEDSFDTGKNNKNKSSKSKKEKKDVHYEDEFDRYWKINKALDKIANNMERLNKLQDRLHGPELIESLEEENKLLDQKVEKQKELLEEQKLDLAETNGRLANSGFTFDEHGEITNYFSQTKQLFQDYQNNIDAYNAGKITEKAYNNAKDAYDKMKKDLSRHDDDIKKIRDTHNTIKDIEEFEKKDNVLKAFQEGIQLRLDTRQAQRDWNDFFTKINTDFKSIYKDYDKILKSKVFNSKSMGHTFDIDVERIEEVEKEIDKMMAGGSSDKFTTVAQARDELKKYTDQMREDASKVFELYESGWEDFNGYIDEAIGKFDKLTNKFERINEDLDHQNKLIELLYGQNDYDNLNKLYNAQKTNLLGEMESLRDQAAFFKKQYEELTAIYGEDNEAAEKFRESWENAVDELHSKEEEYLDALANRYANTINKAFSDFEKKLTGGSTLDFVSEQWDLSKKAAEDVYDEQERIYELQTLGNKYQQAIEKASSTKAQQKLSDLMESQVKALEDKTQLTKYDVELAEKRLAVAEAEAALEDARNNKNALKVTRGDDGNWSYQYVADDEDVDDKEQALLDAQHDAYEFVKGNVSDTKEALMDLAKDWESVIKDLEEKMIGATEEEKIQYQEMIDWYNNYYSQQMNFKADELKRHEVDLAVETNALLQTEYQVNENNYALMTENQKALLDGLAQFGIQSAVDVYNATDEAMSFIEEKGDEVMRETIDYFDTAASAITDRWANDPDSVTNMMIETLDICQNALAEYIQAVSDGCIAAGEDFTNVSAAIDKDTEATKALEDETDKLAEEADKAIHEYIGYLKELEDEWKLVKEWIDDNIQSLMDYQEKIRYVRDDVEELINLINSVPDISNDDDGGPGKKYDPNKYEVVADPNGAHNTWGLKNKDTGQYEQIVGDRALADQWGLNTPNTPFTEGNTLPPSIQKKNDEAIKVVEAKNSNNSQMQLRVGLGIESNKKSLEEYSRDTGNHGFMTNLGYVYITGQDHVPDIEELMRRHYNPYLTFDTGGYTGSWNNSDGRLAMLHQKELVLNAEDTANMLSAVSAIRDLSSVQSNIQQAVADSIAKALVNISGLGNSSTYNNSTVDSSQSNTWNIQANFPDANNVDDIREAILGLPNLASQYSTRKTK